MTGSMLILAMMILGIGDDPDPKEELARFQGVWAVKTCQVGERVVEGYNFALIDGDKITFTFQGKRAPGPIIFTIDPTKRPREIDLKSADDQVMAQGIYKFDGDRLTFATHTKKRPADFDPEAQKQEPFVVLFDFERMDSAKPK